MLQAICIWSPCSCGRQQPRDKKSTAGRRQVGNPSGARHLGSVGGPGTQMWPPLSSSLENSIPQLCTDSGLLSFQGLAQALCLGLELRREWWSQVPDLSQNPSPSEPQVPGKPGWLSTLPSSTLVFFFLCDFELVTSPSGPPCPPQQNKALF